MLFPSLASSPLLQAARKPALAGKALLQQFRFARVTSAKIVLCAVWVAIVPPYANAQAAVPEVYTLRGSARIPVSTAADESAYANLGSGTDPLALPGTVDLSLAWRRALQYDHNYRAAISERMAAETERRQGLAGLLPQVQAGYARSRIDGQITRPTLLGQRASSDVSYDSSNAYAQLQQPILNYARYAGYQRGVQLAEQGAANFAVREQETGSRVARVYLNALLAYEELELNNSLSKSLSGRLRALQARYQHSEGTSTEIQETAARLAIAQADTISAEDNLLVAVRELEAMLGAVPTRILGLDNSVSLSPLQPSSLQDWLDRARNNNAQIRLAQEALDVADAEVDQASSRYLPTIDLVASFAKADSENLSTLSQRTDTFVIGLQMTIPIFTGGYTTAAVSRAREVRRQRQHELNAAIETAMAETTMHYTGVIQGAERVRALEAAVESGEVSVDAAEKGFKYGVTSNLNVLNEQERLFNTRHELIRARLEHLLSQVELARAVGDLATPTFDQINQKYLGRVISLPSLGFRVQGTNGAN